MIEQIADVKVEETDSEIEALITEATLIKKFKPRYNVLLKDDKSYQMVGFTKEEFPRVVMMHQIQAKKVDSKKGGVAWPLHWRICA